MMKQLLLYQHDHLAWRLVSETGIQIAPLSAYFQYQAGGATAAHTAL